MAGKCSRILSPIATPNPSANNVMAAPTNLLPPLAKLRVATSVSDVVSVYPGSSDTMLASTTMFVPIGGTIHAIIHAPMVAKIPAMNSVIAARSLRMFNRTTKVPITIPKIALAIISRMPPEKNRAAAAADKPYASICHSNPKSFGRKCNSRNARVPWAHVKSPSNTWR